MGVLLPSFNSSWRHLSSRPRDLFHAPSLRDVPQRALSLPSRSSSSLTLWKKTQPTVGTPNSKVEDLPLNAKRCLISPCYNLCNPSHPGSQPVRSTTKPAFSHHKQTPPGSLCRPINTAQPGLLLQDPVGAFQQSSDMSDISQMAFSFAPCPSHP